MIRVLTKEYRKGNFAVKTTEVTFFNITIFRYKKITTNNRAVAQLTIVQKSSKIKGFT